VLETLAFFRDPDFACSRFERYRDVYETSLLGQRTVASGWGACRWRTATETTTPRG
jgi:hypothetical protein